MNYRSWGEGEAKPPARSQAEEEGDGEESTRKAAAVKGMTTSVNVHQEDPVSVFGRRLQKKYDSCQAHAEDFLAKAAYAQWRVDFDFDLNTGARMLQEALKSVDLNQQPHLKGAYCFYGGYYAELLEQMKLNEEAEHFYKKIFDLQPTDCQCLGNYALFLHRVKKDYTSAELYYKKAIENYPNHGNIMSKYAKFLKNVKNDVRGAEAYHMKAIEVSPQSIECLGAAAVFLHSLRKDNRKTEALYERALAGDPSHVDILSNYGLFLAEVKQDFPKAKDMYERALVIDPSHGNCLYNYAVMLDGGMKKPEKAEELYRRAVQVNGRHAYALYNLAILLEEKAQDDIQMKEVRQLLQKAVQAAPGDVMTLVDYGRFLLLREKQPGAAEEILRKALKVDENYAPTYFYLGMLLLNARKNKKEAEKHFRTAISKDPLHCASHQYLARILAEDTIKRQHADSHYQKSLDLSPNNVELLLEYSHFLAESQKTTDKEKSRDLYKRAFQVSTATCSSARPLPQSLLVLDPAPTGRSNIQADNVPIPKPSSSVLVPSHSRYRSTDSRSVCLSRPRLHSFPFQGRDRVRHSLENIRPRIPSSSLQSHKAEKRKSSCGSLDYDRNLVRISNPTTTHHHQDPVSMIHPVEAAMRIDPSERKGSRREIRRIRSSTTVVYSPSQGRGQKNGGQVVIKLPMTFTGAPSQAQYGQMNPNVVHHRSHSLPLVPAQNYPNSNPRANPEAVYCDIKASPYIHTADRHQLPKSSSEIFCDDEASGQKEREGLSAWNSEHEVS